MVEWLLSEERVQSYREQQLTATANGHFFQLYVHVFSYVQNDINIFRGILVVVHVTMVKLLLHLLAVLINGK